MSSAWRDLLKTNKTVDNAGPWVTLWGRTVPAQGLVPRFFPLACLVVGVETNKLMAIAAIAAMAATGGCVSNPIGGDGSADGTASDTGDPPPTADGSDGPPLECSTNAECGMCGECEAGVCVEYPGCCAAVPGSPWQWRCTAECVDHDECGPGEECVGSVCVPGPDDPPPPTIEPPPCGEDVTFQVQAIAPGQPLAQIASAVGTGGAIVGVTATGEMVQVGPLEGVTPLGPALGPEVFDLVDAGDAGVMAVARQTGFGGGWTYEVARAWWDGDWSADTSILQGGDVHDAQASPALAALGRPLYVANENGLDLWSGDDIPVQLDRLDIGGDPATQVAMLAGLGTPDGWVGLARGVDEVLVYDVDQQALVASGAIATGPLVDLGAAASPSSGEAELVVLTERWPDDEGGEPWTVVSLLALDPGLPPTSSFGAPGMPRSLVIADADDNGIEDVVVAKADDQLDIYLREAEGISCRATFPVDPLQDVVAVDSDADGRRELMFATGDWVFVVLGLAL